MTRTLLAALLVSAAIPAASQTAAPPPPVQVPAYVAQLRDAALQDDYAWDITEGLTTEVGPRLAGTEAEARARAWSVAKLRAMGFANVRVETFDMPVWVRGEEKAWITAPFPQPLVVTALGNSAATPPQGIEAELVAFTTIDELIAAPDAAVRGKIVFVDHAMPKTQNGSGYGFFGRPRREGPTVASRKGAAAIVVRSIGTDEHRNPHTGVMSFAEGVRPIPAGALTIPDAQQIQRIAKRGRPMRLRLLLTPRDTGRHQSGNVIAEVPGRDAKAPPVLVACHLDSWDLGTGAIDDAAGCGIVAAAAKRIMDAGRPLRPIRIVWFGAE
ncbi:MAG: M28 family peptidase, partial [Sphingomonas sp.]|nr:M28 family peptidase [Sphingomonas sp.]